MKESDCSSDTRAKLWSHIAIDTPHRYSILCSITSPPLYITLVRIRITIPWHPRENRTTKFCDRENEVNNNISVVFSSCVSLMYCSLDSSSPHLPTPPLANLPLASCHQSPRALQQSSSTRFEQELCYESSIYELLLLFIDTPSHPHSLSSHQLPSTLTTTF